MAVFSEDEMRMFDEMVQEGRTNAKKGKKPPISSVLMSLQFATTMPHEDGKMWFEDVPSRTLIGLSIQKLMNDNTPDMFSVGEKAYMFSILNTCRLLQAIDNAGFDVRGFMPNSGNQQDSNESDETDDE